MPDYDVFIIGGGINGCGIARDAAGRGLATGLAEMGDLAQGTSSASTKLIHGGLRYLEHFEFSLVRKALAEREVLLQIAPHIVKPLRFVLPHVSGMRPKWMLRLGLFLYDHLARRVSLPGSHALNLQTDAAGKPLSGSLSAGFEYSDCWVDDARLVVLNARDAARRGADIFTLTKVTAAMREGGSWSITLQTADGGSRQVSARILINAAGPWADLAATQIDGIEHRNRIRLVQGAHIVTRKLFDHDRAYIFQNRDNRIVFAIPYEQDFTLIGTTDTEFDADPSASRATVEEDNYLLAAVNAYFNSQIGENDIVWRFSGVRALVDEGTAKAQAASREYKLEIDANGGAAPVLTVLGGKITSYRTLAEHVLSELAALIPGDERLAQSGWTAAQPLPGGEKSPAELAELQLALSGRYDWADPDIIRRWIALYGAAAENICLSCEEINGMGYHFGSGLHEREVRWLMNNEWACRAEDILWRRTKLGLRFSEEQTAGLDAWMAENPVKTLPGNVEPVFRPETHQIKNPEP